MPEEHVDASELDESEEVFDMELPSCDESTEVVHPCKESFDFPSSSIAAQLPAVLSLLFTVAAVGRNHLDAVRFGHLFIQRGRIVSLVADQSPGQLVEEASGQNSFHKLGLGMRSAFDRYGERKTVASGVRALAAPRGTDGKAPFLALAKVASTNALPMPARPR